MGPSPRDELSAVADGVRRRPDPRAMPRHPLRVRVARVAFWSGVFTLLAMIALAMLAFTVWILVVDWQVLGL